MIKGVLHVHSTYSDGEYDLLELRRLFTAEGCRFICMSDHANAMDDNKLRRYIEECRTSSDEAFTFIPGLEFDCDRRLHLLGYGVTRLANSTNPCEVIEHVRGEGGVAVIAHPRDSEFAWIESFDVPADGIEVWNSKYDGKQAPRARTFRLLHRMQARWPDLRGFFGQDLHWRTQYHGLYTVIDADTVSRSAVLDSLRRGAFVGHKDAMSLPSSGQLSADLLADFDRKNRRASRRRAVMSRLNRLRLRLRIGIPPSVKAALRKLQ